MILSNYISRKKHDDSDPHDIIPISFNMHNVLHEKYYNLGLTDRYLVPTQSQTKSRGMKQTEVHGMKKFLGTNSLPEKQKTASQVKKGSENKPRLGQGRLGVKGKKSHMTKHIDALTDKLQEILKIPATQNLA